MQTPPLIKPQMSSGYVRLDERGMVLGFVPVREASDCETSADIGSERSAVRSALATTEPTSSSTE